jgi:hypothetical protein
MATYGLKTFKADGTTVILQPSSPSAVYAKSITLDNSGTGAVRTSPTPMTIPTPYWYIDYPEYTGRILVPVQLRPGVHEWLVGYTSGVPYIRWNKNTFRPELYNIVEPDFSYSDTVLYLFIK